MLGNDNYFDSNFIIQTSGLSCEIVGVASQMASMSEIEIPNKINGYTVTKIGENAFSNMTKLVYLTLPNSLLYIAGYAFNNCTSLSNIVIPDGVRHINDYVFLRCTNLKTVQFPNNLISIGNSAFSYCSELRSITIPESVTDIGSNAFSNCLKLESIYFNAIRCQDLADNHVLFGNSGIDSTNGIQVRIGANVYKIPGNLFNAKHVNVTSIIFDNNSTCKIIGERAFANLTNLKSIVIPNSVEIIRSSIFYYCDNLNSITLPFIGESVGGNSDVSLGFLFGAGKYPYTYMPGLRTVTVTGDSRIGEKAFSYCSGLTSIKILGNPISIDNSAFEYCTDLADITINNTTSIGDYAFIGCSKLTNVTINKATSIGYIFKGCNNLTNITLPFTGASLNDTTNTHFGYIFGALIYKDNDFYVPSSLKTVKIIGGKINNNTFYNCSSLTNITIPVTVTTIANSAFYNCSSLTNVPIPPFVTTIANSAFYNCSSLTNIIIPSKVTDIGNSAFYNCSSLININIPSSVKNIGSDAFYNCLALKNITLLKSVINIGSNAFYNCKNLIIYAEAVSTPSGWDPAWNPLNCIVVWGHGSQEEDPSAPTIGLQYRLINNNTECEVDGIGIAMLKTNIVIPSTYNGFRVTSIAANAFLNRKNIISVIIPDSVTNIGEYAFESCTSLTSIIIPNSVTQIGRGAFFFCDSLNSMTIPFIGETLYGVSNTHFGYIFNAPVYEYHYFAGALKTVIITGGNKIDDYAFYNCYNLTNITIPNSVTTIGNYAFGFCYELNSITIPNGVNSIGNGAFYRCNSLKSMMIPDSVFSIGSYALYECSNLISVVIGTGITNIDSSMLYGCGNLVNITLPFAGATVNGTSNTHFGYLFGAPNYSNQNSYIPSTLKSVTITGVAGSNAIKENAFYNCYNITDITIMENVNYIGSYAFYNCYSLSNVIMLNGVTNIDAYAFGNCTSLKNAIIPSSGSIGDRAFWGCKDLTHVTIPNGITRIGQGAFGNCENLISVTIPFIGETLNGTSNTNFNYAFGGVKTVTLTGGNIIDDYAFASCYSLENIKIPNSIKSIGKNAFYRCESLKDIILPNNITSIGMDAFTLSGLITITMSNGVTRIEDYTFYMCYDLRSVILPTNLISIGECAFFACESLTNIVLPNTVKSIEGGAFLYCYSLESINIPNSVISIGDNAFRYCRSLKNVIISNSVVNLGQEAFFECVSLTNVTIGYSVTYLEQSTFFNCINLESITVDNNNQNYSSQDGVLYSKIKTTLILFPARKSGKFVIPNSVAYIGESAFNNCSEITNITIPNKVTSIGSYAFQSCRSLSSITIPNNVINIGNYVFDNCESIAIYVEVLSKPNGWNANWSNNSYSYLSIVWGCTLSVDKTYVVSFIRESNSISPVWAYDISAPYRDSYTFSGWATSAGSTVVAYSAGNVNNAPNGTKLYAIWIAD